MWSAMPSKDLKNRLEANARWAAKNPERQRANQRTVTQRWKDNHPIAYMLSGVRQRAKKAGLEFTLTVADFSNPPTHCPVLGIELMYGGGHKDGKTSGGRHNSASIDRIDSRRGYTPGNVRIMSWRANSH